VRRFLRLDLSEETQRYFHIGKHFFRGGIGSCSNCKQPAFKLRSPNFRLLKADGTELTDSLGRRLSTISTIGVTEDIPSVEELGVRKAQKVQCKHCGHTWVVYADYQNPFTIVETHTTEQPIGTTKRMIDNSSSRIPLHKELKLTKQWSRDWAVEYEKMRTVGTNMSARTKLGGEWKRNVENQLRSKYTVSETSTDIYEDTVTVDVPAGEQWIVVTDWKRIWQHGMLQFQDKTEVPFKVAVRVEYDQKYTTPDQ
jgi:hypothetical protein